MLRPHDRIRAALEKLRPSLLPGREAQEAFEAQLLLSESQWLQPEELDAYQLPRLKEFVRFAAQKVPFWRARIASDVIENAASVSEALSRLPIVSRRQLHEDGQSFMADELPKGDAPAGMLSTSGSTGMIVRVASTRLFVRWQKILSLRGYLWADFDFSRNIAVIRRHPPGVAEYPEGLEEPRWGRPEGIPFPTGHAFQLNTRAPLEQQWQWLRRVRPSYLYTMPSLVRVFAQLATSTRESALRRILTTGEVVDERLRSLAANRLHAGIHDRYSTQEAGCIAIQCPDSPLYHVQSEAVILEVLDDDDRPCRPGEIGRVVVTPLFNFATPLIRYDIGDFAQVGPPCTCGRTLPTLARIMGRYRNVLIAPDGKHYWPTLDSFEFFQIAQSHEHQFRQLAPNVLEILLAVDSPRAPAEEDRMRKIVAAALPAPFDIRFRYVSQFPRGPGGKHEEFVSFVSDPASAPQL